MFRSNGKELHVEFTKGKSLSPRPLLLKKGKAAGIVAYWFNWCGPNPGPLKVRLELDGDGVTVQGPFNGPPAYDYVPGCDDKSRPSTLQIVSGFHVGIGLSGGRS